MENQSFRYKKVYCLCYYSQLDLIKEVSSFQQSINPDPLADRLQIKSHLSEDEKKLRFSS